jgi:glycerate 2-kinase
MSTPSLALPHPLDALHREARDMFAHALETCRIDRAMAEHVNFEARTLVLHPSRLIERIRQPIRIDLGAYRSILVIALGKAAIPMLETLLAQMPRRMHVRGICCAPQHRSRGWRFRSFVGGHPLPNEDSFRAARLALRLLSKTTEKTFVLYLISGGGSSMLELPLDPAISLEDTIAFHEALLGSGATIAEINTLRKHFSAVKGGRLATAAPRADKLTLQVADVPLRYLNTIASGPTLPDHSTVEDCRALIERYHLFAKFPPAVQQFFARPDLPETPGDKPGTAIAAHSSPERSFNGYLDTLLSNHDLVNAAREHARALGYRVFVDNTCDDWPWDRAAAYLVERFARLRREHPRLCLLSGGEVTVTLDRAPGTGGRNQQFVLACGRLLARDLPGEAVVALSAGSDGADGNSPVAGALADPTTLARAHAFGYDVAQSLASFDACPLLTALGDTLVTGPTGNNLRDLRILLSRAEPPPTA